MVMVDDAGVGLPQCRGLSNNGTASGDSELETAGLPPLAVPRPDPVQLDGEWLRDDRGYTDIPLTPPLTGVQVAE